MTFGTSVPCPDCGAQLFAAYEGEDNGRPIYVATCSECSFSSPWETFARRMHPRKANNEDSKNTGGRRGRAIRRAGRRM